MTSSGRVFFAAAMVAFFAVICVMSLTLSPAARLLPLLIGIPGMLLAGLVTFQERGSARAEPQTPEVTVAAELTSAAWVAAFWASILFFGFLAGAPLITASYVFFALRYSAFGAILAGGACFAGTYGLFEELFNVPLFEGLLLK